MKFGVFDLDLQTGELRKAGARVRLAGQPLTVLQRLVDRPGDLVTREALRQELWSDSTFGDFERNLNSAIKRLRAALGDSAESPRFIETLPRRGYRFLVPVEHIDEPPTASASVPPGDPTGVPASPAPPAAAEAAGDGAIGQARRPDRDRRRLGGWLAGRRLAGVAMVAGIISFVVFVSTTRDASRSYQAIAVLPFVLADAGSADDEYLAFGLSEALIKELSGLQGPRVISQTSALQYKHAAKGLPRIAKELGVDAVVEGSVQREGNRVRITVQLIEAATDTHLWADSYEREIGSVLTLVDDVARAVAREIHVQVSPAAAARISPARSTDPRVVHAYLRGRYHLGKGTDADGLRALSQFEQALAVDPSHAPSHSGLADYYITTDVIPPGMAFPKARHHARRAIELDDSLPDAHASLAFVHYYYDWDWAAAEREFRRAIALDTRHAKARRWYGLFLSAMRRHPEAIDQIASALAVDPLAIVNHDAAATVRFNARQYRESTTIGRNIADLDGFDARGYEHQTLGLIQLQQYTPALALVEQGLGFSSSSIVLELVRVLCLGRLGRTAQAEQALAGLETGARRQYVPAVFLGIARTELGHHALALDHLERAYEARDSYLVLLNVSPWFDSLRGDPRFRRLHADLKFPR